MLKNFVALLLTGSIFLISAISIMAANIDASAPVKPTALGQVEKFHGRIPFLWGLGLDVLVDGVILVSANNSDNTPGRAANGAKAD